MKTLKIATDFSEFPGARNYEDGPNSGQEFFDKILDQFFSENVKAGMIIDLDNTNGYATSFLDAAFGGLARKYGPKKVMSAITFKSEEEPYLIDEIKNYIERANEN